MSEQINIDGNTFTLVTTTPSLTGTGSTGIYFLNQLLPGFTYDLAIVAYNYSGFSGQGGPIRYYTKEGIYPNPPTGFTAEQIYLNNVIFQWTDQSAIETGFKLYYHRAGL